MSDVAWQEQNSGDFVANVPGYHLRVHRTSTRHHVRFLIATTGTGGAPTVVGSGTVETVGEAMQAAERMASRFSIGPMLESPLILVVDDDEDIRATVADMLRDEGYDVMLAASGDEALRFIVRATREIILVADMHLGGGMDGLELAAAAQELSPISGLLLMSGDLASDPALPHAFLSKPFSTAQLLAALAIAITMAPAPNSSHCRINGSWNGCRDAEETLRG